MFEFFPHAAIALVISLSASSLLAADANSDCCQIDGDMRLAMFLTGTIPIHDEHGDLLGEFKINHLPGAANIAADSIEHFKGALESLSSYIQGEKFWKDSVWGSLTCGVTWAWEQTCNHGLGALCEDYQNMCEDFNSIQLDEFGAVTRKAWACTSFAGKCVGRPLYSAATACLGLGFSIVAPPVILTWPATKATFEAIFAGIAWPTVKLVWHMGAWTMTQLYTKTPAKENSVMVTWRPRV